MGWGAGLKAGVLQNAWGHPVAVLRVLVSCRFGLDHMAKPCSESCDGRAPSPLNFW